MLPFLLVSTRPEDEAIEAEYRSFLRASGLEGEDLQQVRTDLLGLPDIDVTSYSGIFVAGSPYGTTTPDDRKSPTQKRTEGELSHLFTDIVEAGAPCFATGYGMEVAAVLAGAPVTTRWSESPSMTDITLTREGAADPILEGFPAEFHTYVGHHEAVDAPPDGAVVLAKSLSCPIQMLRFSPTFYAAQFNPELDSDAIQQRLATYEDAGYGRPDDLGSLVLIGRSGPGRHQAGHIIKNFVTMFS